MSKRKREGMRGRKGLNKGVIIMIMSKSETRVWSERVREIE